MSLAAGWSAWTAWKKFESSSTWCRRVAPESPVRVDMPPKRLMSLAEAVINIVAGYVVALMTRLLVFWG